MECITYAQKLIRMTAKTTFIKKELKFKKNDKMITD